MIFTRPDQVHHPLYVIAPIFNPVRFRSRWKLYADFAKMIKDAGGILYTVEVAFGGRDFALEALNPENYIKLRSSHELWLKENIINVAFTKLPINWERAAWIDADVVFSRPDFINETLQQLEHYKVVQMWSQSADLSPTFEVIRNFRSYAYCQNNNIPRKGLVDFSTYGAEYHHPGYAWAIRRDAYDQLGGLIDWAILGGGDLFMANAFYDQEYKPPKSLGENGIRMLNIWRDRALKYIKKNVGYVDGLILHHWHGKKIDRRYQDRGTILTDAQFNPEIDLIKDTQGLWQLNIENIALRDGIRNYFRARQEDSIDLE